jgi:hypothetical protein
MSGAPQRAEAANAARAQTANASSRSSGWRGSQAAGLRHCREAEAQRRLRARRLRANI